MDLMAYAVAARPKTESTLGRIWYGPPKRYGHRGSHKYSAALPVRR
jgi:hypothetical protein